MPTFKESTVRRLALPKGTTKGDKPKGSVTYWDDPKGTGGVLGLLVKVQRSGVRS